MNYRSLLGIEHSVCFLNVTKRCLTEVMLQFNYNTDASNILNYYKLIVAYQILITFVLEKITFTAIAKVCNLFSIQVNCL